MATHFFEQQDQARSKTSWLVVMFLVAVVGMVASTMAATAAALHFYGQSQLKSQPEFRPLEMQWQLPVLVGIGTLAVIVLGSLFKTASLRHGGGGGVAENLGGTRLYPNTTDLDEQRVLNVVEEMAIASGTPVPPVYRLAEEGSINAFAAGYSPSDAVIGVTDGAVHSLSRDQLQGVVAHEFSHILNGDMRLGIRLIGILHGILLLGLIGQTVLRIGFYSGHAAGRSRSRKGDKSGGGLVLVVLAVSVTLIVIGALGGL